MSILIILSLLSLAGIGMALWLLKNEQEPGEPSLPKETPEKSAERTGAPPQPASPKAPGKKFKFSTLLKKINLNKKETPVPKTETSEPPAAKPKRSAGPLSGILSKIDPSGILAKLKIGKKEGDQTDHAEGASLPLKGILKKDSETPEPPAGEPAALKTLQEDKPKDALSELQEKYERLDELFKEKASELAETKESLDNEIKHREEFTKIQTLLENEIKEYKNKLHAAQSQSEGSDAEREQYTKETARLKEKVEELEKALCEKEEKISELTKQQPPDAGTKEEKEQQAPPHPPSQEQQEREEAPAAGSSDKQPPDDTPVQMSGTPEPPTPPEPYEEPPLQDGPSGDPPDDPPQEEKTFLKLQPDITEEPEPPKEPEKKGSIASEIEESLKSTQEPEEAPGSEQPSAPLQPDQEIIPIQEPENEDPQKTDNTKTENEKE